MALGGVVEIHIVLGHFVHFLSQVTYNSLVVAALHTPHRVPLPCTPVFLPKGADANDTENCPALDRERRRSVFAFCRLSGAHGKTCPSQRPFAPRGNSRSKPSGKHRTAARPAGRKKFAADCRTLQPARASERCGRSRCRRRHSRHHFGTCTNFPGSPRSGDSCAKTRCWRWSISACRPIFVLRSAAADSSARVRLAASPQLRNRGDCPSLSRHELHRRASLPHASRLPSQSLVPTPLDPRALARAGPLHFYRPPD